MKLAILTTETPHHIYFTEQMADLFGNLQIILETGSVGSQRYETYHPYENIRDEFERGRWFSGRDPSFVVLCQ